MATNLPILHYFKKYTKFKCWYITTGYLNQNDFFLVIGHSYVQIAIFEKFFQILVAGFLLFQGCSYGSVALGSEGDMKACLDLQCILVHFNCLFSLGLSTLGFLYQNMHWQ